LKPKVHVVIDEAGSVGRMESITDVLNVGRGFGLRMQLYYQDTGQLQKCWENPQGVLANTTKIFFSCQDYQTAEMLSKSLGPETIVVASGGTNRSTTTNYGSSSGSSTNEGSNSNWQQQSRELLKPDEVLQLDPRIAITQTPGMRPIQTKLIRYYEEPELFRRRAPRPLSAVRTFILSALLFAATCAVAIAVTQEFQEMNARQRPAPAVYPIRPWQPTR
jgi:type IV secretion system protein VirD4